MASSIEKENASNIANKLGGLPNLKQFFEILLNNVDVKCEAVGDKFEYPCSIVKNNLHGTYGVFMDYFVRKVLSNKYSIDLRDDYTELVLNDKKKYFGKGRFLPAIRKNLSKDIEENYLVFKDIKTEAMDILKSIKIVSLSTVLFFDDKLPRIEIDSKNDNLLAIIKYLKNLDYAEVDIKSNVDCQYFNGNADIIFDQKVMYEIKTSQYTNLKRADQQFSVKNFYKLILYAFGYYKKTGTVLKQFIIYNPLLGYIYKLQMNDIDMVQFENAIKKDLNVIPK